MSRKWYIGLILALSLHSCSSKNTNNYSSFPVNAVLTGTMKDGSILYLIRDNEKRMSGKGFKDDNHAIVKTFGFTADAVGNTVFRVGNHYFNGNITVDTATQEIELTIPDIPDCNIVSQKINLVVKDVMQTDIDCIERYKEPVFDNVETTKDILYGSAPGFYTSKPIDYIKNDDYTNIFREMFKAYKASVVEQGQTEQELLLDIYKPGNDTDTKRPVLVLIHGGSFFFGDKENKMQQAMTDYFVRRGYVVVSVNYRLCSTLLGKAAVERTIYRAVQDTRAALRYLVHHQKALGVDANQIYLSGSSAGGIIALTTAFMDSDEVYGSTRENFFRENLGGLDESGNRLTEPVLIAGVVSMWGGVTELRILNNQIPTLLFHGTEDDIVPCDEGLPFKKYMGEAISGLVSSVGKIYGSESMFKYLNTANFPIRYIPLAGCGHEAHVNPDGSLNSTVDLISEETGKFLYENISKDYFNYNLSGPTGVKKTDKASEYYLDNAQNVSVQWQVDGGFITGKSNKAVRVVWFDTTNTGTITAYITDKKGVSCRKEVEINLTD